MYPVNNSNSMNPEVREPVVQETQQGNPFTRLINRIIQIARSAFAAMASVVQSLFSSNKKVEVKTLDHTPVRTPTSEKVSPSPVVTEKEDAPVAMITIKRVAAFVTTLFFVGAVSFLNVNAKNSTEGLV